MTTRKTGSSKYETASGRASPVDHLSQSQLHRLIEAFNAWNEAAATNYIRRVRGRYWLAFLLLRFSGARIGEILCVDDSADIDFFQNEIKLAARSRSRVKSRKVPVPPEIISKIITYRLEFPRMKGKVFLLDPGNFRKEFYRRAEEAEIPRDLSHPHILRHTRAVEMLKAGVPLTTVQQILGHTLTSTTAIYLQHSEEAAWKILKEKGLL